MFKSNNALSVHIRILLKNYTFSTYINAHSIYINIITMSEAKLKNNYISVDTGSARSYGGSQLWFDKKIQKSGCSLIAAADVLLYLQSRRFDSERSLHVSESGKGSGSGRKVSKSPDTAYSLHGNNTEYGSENRAYEIDIDTYKRYIRLISPAFPFIPYRGIPAVILAASLNLYMRIRKLPYKAAFGTTAAKPKAPSAFSRYAQTKTHYDNADSEQPLNKRNNNTSRLQQLFKLKLPPAFSRRTAGQALCNTVTASLEQDLPVILGIGPGVHQCLLPKAERGITFYLYNKKTDAFAPVKKVRSHFVVVTEIKDDFLTVSSWGCKYHISLTEYARYSKLDMFGLFSGIIYLTEGSL